MRAAFLFTVGLFLFPAWTWGQACYDYPCVIEKVKKALAGKEYQKAYENLESAAAYPGSRPEEIAALRQELFVSIQREKEQAESEKLRAERAENRVRSTLRIVEEERDRSETLRREAEQNSEVNRIMVEALRVRDDKPVLTARLADQAYQVSGRSNPLASGIRRDLYQDPKINMYTREFIGHESRVTVARFSPDSKAILTADQDGKVFLWDLEGRMLSRFFGHTGGVSSAAFSPDGKFILTGGLSGEAFIWDPDGKPLVRLEGHQDEILLIAIIEQGQNVITIGIDRDLRIWDLEGNELKRFPLNDPDGSDITDVDISPTGKSLSVLNDDGTLSLWSLEGVELQRLNVQGETLISMAFSPDGRQIITGSENGVISLWKADGEIVKMVSGKPGRFNSVIFSANGENAISGDSDGALVLWDLNGKALGQYTGNDRSLEFSTIDVSPDGRHLVAGGSYPRQNSGCCSVFLWEIYPPALQGLSWTTENALFSVISPDEQKVLAGYDDWTARLWNFNREELQVFTGHKGAVATGVFSPDGQLLLTGSRDHIAKLWSPDGREIQSFDGHQGELFSVAFSPDQASILTAGADGTARLWNLQGDLVTTFAGHQGSVFSAAFSPGGQQVITGGEDGTCRIWDLAGREQKQIQSHHAPVRAVAFSEDGTLFLTGSDDRSVKLWDSNGKELRYFDGCEGGVTSLAFVPYSQVVVIGTADGDIMLWDTPSGRSNVLERHDSAVQWISKFTHGVRFSVGTKSEDARIWNVQGEELERFARFPWDLNAMAFSPAGRELLTASDNPVFKLWDLETPLEEGLILPDLHLSMAFDLRDPSQPLPDDYGSGIPKIQLPVGQSFIGHQRAVNAVAFSPDGQHLLSGSSDRTARTWKKNGEELQVFSGHESDVLAVAFSPTGQTILTGSADNTSRIWNLSGRELICFKGHQDDVLSVSFSPDGRTALTGSLDNTARIWDLKGRELLQLTGHADGVRAVAFSPDGRRLLTGSEKGEIILWDTDGQILQRYSNPAGGVVRSLAFAPDGQSVMINWEKTVSKWDLSGNLLQEFAPDRVRSAAFSPDGRYIVLAERSGTVWLVEDIDSYYSRRQKLNFSECLKYGIPFDYRDSSDPGSVLDYASGFRHKMVQGESLSQQLAYADSARAVIEYMRERWGKAYDFFLAENFYDRANVYFSHQQYLQAAAELQQSLITDPRQVWLNVDLSTAWLYGGEWEKAKAIYDQWAGKAWDQSISGYARTWLEAFYKHVTQDREVIPEDPQLIEQAKQYLVQLMTQGE